MMFKGSMTAIVTPFKDGRVDEKALRRLVDWQIASGTDAIVVCGTTGEAATLTYDEHFAVIDAAVEEAAGRVPVLAGAGSNATANAIKLARQAKEAGADAQLQVTPYYNKPTQEGLYQHFRAIAEVVDLPMILYNVPGRTSVNLLPETTARLSNIDSIVGIKEASGDLGQVREAIAKTPDGGDDDEAGRLHKELAKLNKAMFIETNPIPAKTSLAVMGRIQEEFRLPLTPMSEGNRRELKDVLKEYGLI